MEKTIERANTDRTNGKLALLGFANSGSSCFHFASGAHGMAFLWLVPSAVDLNGLKGIAGGTGTGNGEEEPV